MKILREIVFKIKVIRFGVKKVQVTLLGAEKSVILGTCRTEEEAEAIVRSAVQAMEKHTEFPT